MHDETPARQPLIHVAGDDRHCRRIGLRDSFAFGHPSTDEHIELLELVRPLTLVCLHTRSSFSHLRLHRPMRIPRHLSEPRLTALPACCVTLDVETCSPYTAGSCRAHCAATTWRSRSRRRSFRACQRRLGPYWKRAGPTNVITASCRASIANPQAFMHSRAVRFQSRHLR